MSSKTNITTTMKTDIATKAKITRATFASFVKKHRAELLIKHEGGFDAMTDGWSHSEDRAFGPVQEPHNNHPEYDFGIRGAWVLRSSRNLFQLFENETLIGISVYNCCRSFVIAIAK